MELYVNRENAIPLNEGEFHVADMVGADIVTDDGNHFGTLQDVLKTGANDVYVIKTDEVVDMSNSNLDDWEKSGNYEVRVIPLDEVESVLNSTLKDNPINEIVRSVPGSVVISILPGVTE